MSKSATRFPWEQALEWAVEVHDLLKGFTTRVEIAGSIRRGRPDVGDIDIVLLDSASNPWQHTFINSKLSEMGYRQTKDGDLIASFTHEERAGLDLYYADPSTWGITLLVRTGSAAHNVKMVEVARKMTPSRRLEVSRGIVDTAGRVIASNEESDIFTALKLPFIEPPDREAPEYQYMIRDDA